MEKEYAVIENAPFSSQQRSSILNGLFDDAEILGRDCGGNLVISYRAGTYRPEQNIQSEEQMKITAGLDQMEAFESLSG
jgi:hypothetical protein